MSDRPVLLDLKDGKQTVVDAADWPRVRELTVYLGTNGYAYYSKWEDGRSYPRTNRKNLHLGLFATEAEAIVARRAAELEHFGEYCP